MWRNDTKCKHMFMFPLKNLAYKGLSQKELTALMGTSLPFIAGMSLYGNILLQLSFLLCHAKNMTAIMNSLLIRPNEEEDL